VAVQDDKMVNVADILFASEKSSTAGPYIMLQESS
jgi:hypothetical protein